MIWKIRKPYLSIFKHRYQEYFMILSKYTTVPIIQHLFLQVAAAHHVACAAMATHHGNAELAASAVLQAADGVNKALQEQAKNYRNIKSRMCLIL